MEFLQVMCAVPSREEADSIADDLLRRRLAACVQIVGPVGSRFWWEGEVQDATEWLCLVKTVADCYDDVEAAIRSRHSYEVPEILAVPVTRGSVEYLRWLGDTLVPPTG